MQDAVGIHDQRSAIDSMRGLYRLAALLVAAACAPVMAMAATRHQPTKVFDALARPASVRAAAGADDAAGGRTQQDSEHDDAGNAASSVHPTVPAPASPVSEQPPYVQLLAGLGVVVWLGLRSTASQ